MSNKVLYYPTIVIPNEQWLRQTILYVDKIASIVPHDLESDIYYNRHIQMLYDNDLYQPLSPEEFLYSNDNERKDFENDFVHFLRSPQFKEYRRTVNRFRRPNGNKRQIFRIHGSKFSYQIHDLLERNKLITSSSDKWYEIDENIAKIYMGILAKHMALKNNFTPATHANYQAKTIFNETRSESGYPVAFMQLLNCLPAPSPSTPINKILDFKSKKDKELKNFQAKLLDFQSRIANAESQEARNHIVNVFENELNIGLQELNEYFHESRIKQVVSSVRTLFDIKNPAILSGSTIGASLVASHPTLTTLSVAGLTVGLVHINHHLERRQKALGHPFSYVFHARKQFIPAGINRN